MVAHQILGNHKRAAAAKNRRLPPDVEADMLKRLIARYSPTQVYTETETETSPTDTAIVVPDPTSPPVAETTSTTPAAPAPTDTTPTGATLAPINSNTIPTSTFPPILTQPTTTIPIGPAVVITTPTTTSVGTPSIVTTPSVVPKLSTITTSVSPTVASAAASSTQVETSGSGTNVGGIVGGIAGGLLGLAALIFLVRFIMNRQRRRDEDGAAAFDAHDFRRSAVMMNDPPTHNDTVQRGFNPRPPSMIERRLASPAPTFGTQYGAPGPYARPSDYGNTDYEQYQAYGPVSTRSPHSANPAYPGAAYPSPVYPNQNYGQSPFSPIGSPVSTAFESSQTAVLTRQASNATQLSRQHSAGSANGYPQDESAQNVDHRVDYIDMDRSSVTPFQAAQYAEISQRLNTEVPAGMATPAVNEYFQNNAADNAPPVPAKGTSDTSPFADPIPTALYPGAGPAARPSSDSDGPGQDLDDFPAPPSPSHSSLTRIDSNPPMLPEIRVESRPSSYDFPTSVRGSGLASGFPSPVAKEFMRSPLGANFQFPMTPSPLASSFGIPTPPPAATSFPSPPVPAVAPNAKRPETMYDDDDAYGGI